MIRICGEGRPPSLWAVALVALLASVSPARQHFA